MLVIDHAKEKDWLNQNLHDLFAEDPLLDDRQKMKPRGQGKTTLLRLSPVFVRQRELGGQTSIDVPLINNS